MIIDDLACCHHSYYFYHSRLKLWKIHMAFCNESGSVMLQYCNNLVCGLQVAVNISFVMPIRLMRILYQQRLHLNLSVKCFFIKVCLYMCVSLIRIDYLPVSAAKWQNRSKICFFFNFYLG